MKKAKVAFWPEGFWGVRYELFDCLMVDMKIDAGLAEIEPVPTDAVQYRETGSRIATLVATNGKVMRWWPWWKRLVYWRIVALRKRFANCSKNGHELYPTALSAWQYCSKCRRYIPSG